MNIFGYEIDKRTLVIAFGIALALLVLILFVNHKTSKKEEHLFESFEDMYEEEIDLEGDMDMAGIIAFYNFEDIMPYFETTMDALEFKQYLNDYVVNSGTRETEWWVTTVAYNSRSCELSFMLQSNSNETFIIRKNNKNTYISKSIQKRNLQ
ncbi:MAG: hypothetical protein MJ245_04935 [Clostridia bacterium]|nr:hypothetical protein [Clostridia bacterium]